MVHRTQLRQASVAALVVALAACSRGSNVSNAAPRISNVPQQSTTGGLFGLDLSSYVTDREGATLSYAVVSGGGSFAGSNYSNTFAAMGTYTVNFAVSDGSKTSTGSFEVKVTSSDFAVVTEDSSGLFLLDTATNQQVRVAAAAPAPTFAAGLGDGRLVYQTSSPAKLWVFDPMTRKSEQLGAGESGDVTYRAKTSDDKVVYTTGATSDQTIWFYNPLTNFARNIDDGAISTVTVLVNAADLVFYEAAVGGQADVFYYDPVEDESVTVGDAATDEQLQAVLPNGGVVFSRIGPGGETDLFYFKVGTGLVEIGHDVTALDTRSKSYDLCGSNSEVVFTATNAGDREVWVWDPGTGQTTAVVTGSDNVVDGIGDGNEVVYHTVVSGTEHDVFCYDIDDDSTVTVRNAGDIGQVLAVTRGTPAFAIVLGDGATSSLHAVSLVASPVTTTWAAGGAVATTVGQLTNGDVVAQRVDGTAINSFDVSGAAWGTPIAGVGLAFAGDGLDDGDFVYTVTVSAQTDLGMWDESAAMSVSVSNTTGADDFQASTPNGTVLFTRVVGTNTTADLFVWDGATETRLTDEDAASLFHDHAVSAQYSGSR